MGTNNFKEQIKPFFWVEHESTVSVCLNVGEYKTEIFQSRVHFIGVTPGCAEDIMLTFLWLDEDDRSTIHLFQLVRNPGKCNASDDKSVRYYDNDDWPAHAPVGMWLEYGLVNDFMREWCLRKEQLKNGEISEDEYFEWKINWPATSSKVDYNGKDDKKCSYQWRKK